MAGETGTRVAIVLGGAGGIGSAICRRLAGDGYRLGIGDAAAEGAAAAGNSSSGCHYVASKAGLIGLSKALAGELAPQGVRVNSVAPGWVATPLTADQRPEIVAALRAAVPMGRTARPEDIAGAVAFLLSDDAAFITGATLDVNGGRIML